MLKWGWKINAHQVLFFFLCLRRKAAVILVNEELQSHAKAGGGLEETT